MKVKIKGNHRTQFEINGHFYSGGTVMEVDNTLFSKHNDVFEKKEEKKKQEQSSKKKVYTEKELFALNKAEQVKILKSYGVKKIPKYEKTRVKKILALQEGSE